MKFLLDGNTPCLLFCFSVAVEWILLWQYVLYYYIKVVWHIPADIHSSATSLTVKSRFERVTDLAHWNCHQLGLKAVQTWIVFNWHSIVRESSVQLMGLHTTQFHLESLNNSFSQFETKFSARAHAHTHTHTHTVQLKSTFWGTTKSKKHVLT